MTRWLKLIRNSSFALFIGCFSTDFTHSVQAQILEKARAQIALGRVRVNTATGYEVDPTWPKQAVSQTAHNHGWGEMSGLCVDHVGNIMAFHRGRMPVQVFNPQGDMIRSWGEGQFGRPHQIRLDKDGNIWMADAGLHVVRKFTPDGKLLQTLGTPGKAGGDQAHFNQPTDMAISADGNVYVSDGYGNNRVVQFDSNGQFVRSWGRLGSNPGEFNLPHSIAVDSNGNLYVADRSNARVQVFDGNGRFLQQWTGLVVPWHIVVTENNDVYICGSSAMRWPKLSLPGVPLGIPPKDQVVAVFDTTGRMLRQWFIPKGSKPGEVDWLHAMAVDASGNLYLGDIKGQRAQRFLIQDDSRTGILAEKPKVDSTIKKVENPQAK